MRFLFYFFCLTFFCFSCGDTINQSSPKTAHFKASDSRKPISDSNYEHSKNSSPQKGLSGISTSTNIFLQDGIVYLKLQDGVFTTSSGTTVRLITDNQIIGTLSLRNAVTNFPINGITLATNDQISITPDNPLVPEIVYALTFLDNRTKMEVNEKIFISTANYCNPDSLYSNIPLQKLPTSSNQFARLEIKNNIFKDPLLGPIMVVGWDHQSSNNFYFKINDRTAGAKYKIVTSYGAYNIPEHECELYYQRDTTSPYPTWIDNNYGAKNTKVTWEDTTFHNPISKEYYRFTKTFIVLKVFDSSNVDITSIDSAVVSLQQTDSVYGLPISNIEEDSSLLAYLNRGNNNSYSMVLIGLTVGIFAFFLSRRLLNNKEEN